MSDDPLPNSEIVFYQTEYDRTRIRCRFDIETVWLSLNQMADLFRRDKSVSSRHIKNAFAEGELNQSGRKGLGFAEVRPLLAILGLILFKEDSKIPFNVLRYLLTISHLLI